MGKLILFHIQIPHQSTIKTELKKHPGEQKHVFCLKGSPAASFHEVMGQKKTGVKALKMWHTLIQALFKHMPNTEHTIKSFLGRQTEQRDFLCQ